jgi:hypothetical protein
MNWQECRLRLLGAALALLPTQVFALDSEAAVRIANLWSRIDYPGDAHEAYQRAQHVHAADLDGDGREEVIYLRRVTCYGGGSSAGCANEVTVLRTPIAGSSWLHKTSEANISIFDDPKASVIASGYERDAMLQIPGDITRLTILDGAIQVTFVASLKSDTCVRDHSRFSAVPPQPDTCPAPGRHVWRLHWKPGELSR